jgi:MoxR-like ATPase
MKKAFWIIGDLLWDSDIRPEGLGFKLNWRFKNIKLFENISLLFLDEIKDRPDPMLFIIQSRIRRKIYSNIYLKQL